MRCPACDSTRVFPSRLRGSFERLRQMITDKQPYRCHDCGWRRWRDLCVLPESPPVHPEDLRTGLAPQPLSPAELDALDSAPRRSS
jgi:hypothetical protein